METTASTVVLVAGGFLGPWVWQEVQSRLHAADVGTVAVPLASVPMTDGTRAGDFDEDVTAVRHALDDLTGQALLCGHSYAGAVITQAASGPHPAVTRLVYLAAAAPDRGESLADLAPTPDPAGPDDDAGEAEQAEQVEFGPDGTIRLTIHAATTGLFNDCTADAASQAAAQLRAMNPTVNAQPVQATAAWRQLPSSYVRCTRDRLPELLSGQFLASVEDVTELPTGHCPQWSRPDLVADLLLQRAR